MLNNKLEKPCREFMEAKPPYWIDTSICFACEWPREEHPTFCEECFCNGTGEIWGPCADYSRDFIHNHTKCVMVAYCDCHCHIKTTGLRNARIESRPSKKRRSLTLPYVRIKHDYK